MKVYVNDRELEVAPGMKVKHAVIAAGLMDLGQQGRKVYDDLGNEVGLDGALEEESKIYIR